MAKEKRLIDANALGRESFHIREYGYYSERCVVDWDDIESAPTVDAAPVVHGRWEQVQRWATKAKYRCSVCGREIMSAVKVNTEKYPYCHCGAKMDGNKNA